MNKTTATVRVLTICVAAALGFNASNASAAGVSSNQSVTHGVLTYVVRFSDLDVSKFAGVKTLYSRLRHAATVVCKPLETAHLWNSDQYEVCTTKAINDAVSGVNRPLLTQYHQSRTSGDKARIMELARAN